MLTDNQLIYDDIIKTLKPLGQQASNPMDFYSGCKVGATMGANLVLKKILELAKTGEVYTLKPEDAQQKTVGSVETLHRVAKYLQDQYLLEMEENFIYSQEPSIMGS